MKKRQEEALKVEGINQWLSNAFNEDITDLSCLSDNGGNHLYKGSVKQHAYYFRLMPYDEEKWQLFSVLKANPMPQLVQVIDLKVEGRLMLIKEGECRGAALNIGLKAIKADAHALERFYLSLANLMLDLQWLYSHYGLLHLDIKPEHLILTNEGMLGLIDFGGGYSNTNRTNLKRLPQQGSADYVCASRRQDFNAVGPHVDLFALMQSVRNSFMEAEFENPLILLELESMINRLNQYDKSTVFLYSEIRHQWLEMFMKQYGHITNR